MTDSFVPRDRQAESVSSSVIERARQGEAEAFQRINQLYAGLVYYWCRRQGLVEQDAEDVSQQVFLTVCTHLHSFKREKPSDSFRAWLRVITRSRIIDFLRTNQHRELAKGGAESLDDLPALMSETETADELSFARAHLYERAIQFLEAEFSQPKRQAFLLNVVHGVPAQEVATQLGISVNAVYILKSRILKRLRTEFAELVEFESAHD